MAFVKVVKNKAYFKRFQVKYRRRREGKTDYRARKRLVAQDKNKHNSPRYRFVVRFTNKDVIAQIAYAKITGDFVLAAAYSHELPRYGVPSGLTNYAATYATGLLLARRLLKKLKLEKKYQGQTEISGDDYHVEPAATGPRPFRALLDVGLRRTTTGSKLFAALKGATDGGLDIPHNEKRYVGYDKEQKKLDPAVLRAHIFASHVADYMKKLKDENAESYATQFGRYIKEKIKPEDLPALWGKVHKAIRADPSSKLTAKKGPSPLNKKHRKIKLSLSQRKDKVRQKLASKSRQQATK